MGKPWAAETHSGHVADQPGRVRRAFSEGHVGKTGKGAQRMRIPRLSKGPGAGRSCEHLERFKRGKSKGKLNSQGRGAVPGEGGTPAAHSSPLLPAPETAASTPGPGECRGPAWWGEFSCSQEGPHPDPGAAPHPESVQVSADHVVYLPANYRRKWGRGSSPRAWGWGPTGSRPRIAWGPGRILGPWAGPPGPRIPEVGPPAPPAAGLGARLTRRCGGAPRRPAA